MGGDFLDSSEERLRMTAVTEKDVSLFFEQPPGDIDKKDWAILKLAYESLPLESNWAKDLVRDTIQSLRQAGAERTIAIANLSSHILRALGNELARVGSLWLTTDKKERLAEAVKGLSQEDSLREMVRDIYLYHLKNPDTDITDIALKRKLIYYFARK